MESSYERIPTIQNVLTGKRQNNKLLNLKSYIRYDG